MRLSVLALACVLLCPAPAFASDEGTVPEGACKGAVVDVDGQPLWIEAHSGGAVTIAFEAGNGNDSSVWTEIAGRVRERGLGTFAYDRAGLGKSPLRPGSYAIENEVRAFNAALTTCGIRAPIVLVAHSYGGAIALLSAAHDRRIVGLVLVEGLVPKSAPQGEIDAIFAKYRPQYDEIRKQAPALAEAIIPLMEAFPETSRILDAVVLPKGLPVIDIVAEHPNENSPQSIPIWRTAHADFVRSDPAREAVFAAGSSHKVMADRPDLVVAAILRMVERSKPGMAGGSTR